MKTKLHISVILLTAILSSCGKPSNTTKPQRKDLTEMVFASGDLVADGQYNVEAQTDGYLVKVNFKEGDVVNTSQLLAVIDNNENIYNSKSAASLHVIAKSNIQPNAPALLQIGANIEAAQAKLALDNQQLERYKRLYTSNSVSKNEYENAELTAVNSKANLDALQEQYKNQKIAAQQQEVSQRYLNEISNVIKGQNIIKAVAPGRIYLKQKQLGDYVRKGDVIAVVGNPDLIYAQLNVDETNMAKLKLGQPVFVQLNTNKGKVYKAQVHEILPSFDASSQSFLIKAYFTDSLDFRITGTQLEANILVGEKKNALVIPRSFLGYGNKVTLKKDKKLIEVKTGIVSSDWVEILSGLNENEEIFSDDKQ